MFPYKFSLRAALALESWIELALCLPNMLECNFDNITDFKLKSSVAWIHLILELGSGNSYFKKFKLFLSTIFDLRNNIAFSRYVLETWCRLNTPSSHCTFWDHLRLHYSPQILSQYWLTFILSSEKILEINYSLEHTYFLNSWTCSHCSLSHTATLIFYPTAKLVYQVLENCIITILSPGWKSTAVEEHLPPPKKKDGLNVEIQPLLSPDLIIVLGFNPIHIYLRISPLTIVRHTSE